MAQTFYKETDGQSVDVTLEHTITGEKPILVDGIAGLPFESGDSGDTRAIRADGAVYRVQIPAGLTVAIGDTIYVTIASVSEHEIPDAAYTTSSGAGVVPFLRVLSEKDSNNWIDGKLINFNS
jgi:hypothetical protein